MRLKEGKKKEKKKRMADNRKEEEKTWDGPTTGKHLRQIIFKVIK